MLVTCLHKLATVCVFLDLPDGTLQPKSGIKIEGPTCTLMSLKCTNWIHLVNFQNGEIEMWLQKDKRALGHRQLYNVRSIFVNHSYSGVNHQLSMV